MDTPIEILRAALEEADPRGDHLLPGTTLVPEQCMELYIGDKRFHVTIEEIK